MLHCRVVIHFTHSRGAACYATDMPWYSTGRPQAGIMSGAPSETLRHAREHIRKRPASAIKPQWASGMDPQRRDRCRGRCSLFRGGRAEQRFSDCAREGHLLARRGYFLGRPDRALVHCAMACPGRRDGCHRRGQSFFVAFFSGHCRLGPRERR